MGHQDEAVKGVGLILPQSTYQKLCQLWQAWRESEPEEQWFLDEGDLPEPLGEQEVFLLWVTPQEQFLLRGKPQLVNGTMTLVYPVEMTLDPLVVGEFLDRLRQRFPALVQDFPQPPIANRPDRQALQTWVHNLLACIDQPLATEGRQSFPQPSLENLLRQRLEQERILNQVTQQINQNLDLWVIVRMALEQVQRLLQTDRLLVYQLKVPPRDPQQQAVDQVVCESRSSETIRSLLFFQEETCFSSQSPTGERYCQGLSLAINDLSCDTQLSSCLRDRLLSLDVRAKLVTPILVQNELWGLLIAHQCYKPRRWKRHEIRFLRHVADYLAIAIYQAQSYDQLQNQKQQLELLVNQRAQELQDALSAAQIASRSKEEFIGTMSHELLSPLTCIIGLASTLSHCLQPGAKAHLRPEKQVEYLHIIQNSGRKLQELITNILEVAQNEAAKSVLELKEFSLFHLAQSSLARFQDAALRQNVNLTLDWRIPSPYDRFCADQARLEQVLFQLLSNGLKFTPTGGKVILRGWWDQGYMVLQVEDSGIGITPQQVPLLFETFQQLEPALQRTYGGAGLGLALAKQWVEMHRGTIEVDSQPGQGSKFTIRIPPQHPSIPKLPPTAERSDLPQGTILLVTQDEEAATLVCELLTAGHYQVIWLIDDAILSLQISVLSPHLVMLDGDFPPAQIPMTRVPLLWFGREPGQEQPFVKKPLQPAQLLDWVNRLVPGPV